MFLNACVCIRFAIGRSLVGTSSGCQRRRAAADVHAYGKCVAHVLHTVRVRAACALMPQRP